MFTAPESGVNVLRSVATRNRLTVIFCFLALTAVAAGTAIIVCLSSVEVGTDAVSAVHVPKVTHPHKAPTTEMALAIRGHLSILAGIIVACVASMTYLFVNRIARPLNAIAKATEEMAKGDLSVTAPSGGRDEMGELARVINDLAINFQEVLLLAGTIVGNSCAMMDKMQHSVEREGPAQRNELKEQIEDLRKDLEMLGTLVEDFQFYQTRFDGQKVVSRRTRPEV